MTRGEGALLRMTRGEGGDSRNNEQGEGDCLHFLPRFSSYVIQTFWT